MEAAPPSKPPRGRNRRAVLLMLSLALIVAWQAGMFFMEQAGIRLGSELRPFAVFGDQRSILGLTRSARRYLFPHLSHTSAVLGAEFVPAVNMTCTDTDEGGFLCSGFEGSIAWAEVEAACARGRLGGGALLGASGFFMPATRWQALRTHAARVLLLGGGEEGAPSPAASSTFGLGRTVEPWAAAPFASSPPALLRHRLMMSPAFLFDARFEVLLEAAATCELAAWMSGGGGGSAAAGAAATPAPLAPVSGGAEGVGPAAAPAVPVAATAAAAAAGGGGDEMLPPSSSGRAHGGRRGGRHLLAVAARAGPASGELGEPEQGAGAGSGGQHGQGESAVDAAAAAAGAAESADEAAEEEGGGLPGAGDAAPPSPATLLEGVLAPLLSGPSMGRFVVGLTAAPQALSTSPFWSRIFRRAVASGGGADPAPGLSARAPGLREAAAAVSVELALGPAAAARGNGPADDPDSGDREWVSAAALTAALRDVQLEGYSGGGGGGLRVHDRGLVLHALSRPSMGELFPRGGDVFQGVATGNGSRVHAGFNPPRASSLAGHYLTAFNVIVTAGGSLQSYPAAAGAEGGGGGRHTAGRGGRAAGGARGARHHGAGSTGARGQLAAHLAVAASAPPPPLPALPGAPESGLPSYVSFAKTTCEGDVRDFLPVGGAGAGGGAGLRALPVYAEVLVLTQRFEWNLYHWTSEALGKLGPVLDYLLAHPHVRLHLMDLGNGQAAVSKFRVEHLGLLGLDFRGRVVRGALRARVVHYPDPHACSFPHGLWGVTLRERYRAALGFPTLPAPLPAAAAGAPEQSASALGPAPRAPAAAAAGASDAGDAAAAPSAGAPGAARPAIVGKAAPVPAGEEAAEEEEGEGEDEEGGEGGPLDAPPESLAGDPELGGQDREPGLAAAVGRSGGGSAASGQAAGLGLGEEDEEGGEEEEEGEARGPPQPLGGGQAAAAPRRLRLLSLPGPASGLDTRIDAPSAPQPPPQRERGGGGTIDASSLSANASSPSSPPGRRRGGRRPAAPAPLPTEARRVVFFRRRNYRRITNEAALLERLAGLPGVTVTEIRDWELPDQRATLAAVAAADIIIGAHGAGLANTIVARPGACVVEVMAYFWFVPCYVRLSLQLGLQHHLFTVPGKKLAPLTVEVHRIMAALRHCRGAGAGDA